MLTSTNTELKTSMATFEMLCVGGTLDQEPSNSFEVHVVNQFESPIMAPSHLEPDAYL